MTLEQLHEAEREQTDARLTAYWNKLPQALKRATVSPKFAAELMQLARECGKSASDVEQDLELLGELELLENAEQQHVDAMAAEREVSRRSQAKMAEAQQLEARVIALRNEAQNERHAAHVATRSAAESVVRLRDIKGKLSAARHPRFLSQAEQDRLSRKIENLQTELRMVDMRLREFTASRVEAGLVTSQALELRRLQQRRAEIASELQRLGTEAPPAPPHVEPVVITGRPDEPVAHDEGPRLTIHEDD
ncbi:MAG: hypothetical protein JNL08_05800 [Planctomycetes bacterium]|nr:hypothetical protein [Planctomycetota bacterium]